jgi:hypothetical protein
VKRGAGSGLRRVACYLFWNWLGVTWTGRKGLLRGPSRGDFPSQLTAILELMRTRGIRLFN